MIITLIVYLVQNFILKKCKGSLKFRGLSIILILVMLNSWENKKESL